jgi:hypothetical protein
VAPGNQIQTNASVDRFGLEGILNLLADVRMGRQQRDLFVGALDPCSQGGIVRIEERYSDDRGCLEHRSNLAPWIAFFDSLDQAARNTRSICKLLRRHPTLLASELDLPAKQSNGLPTGSREWAYFGFRHNLVHA